MSGKRNPIDEVLAAFWDSRDSAHSKRGYVHDWREYEAWCASSNVAILKAKPSDVQRYVLELRDRGLAPSTRARALSVIRSCYDALVVNDLLMANPAKSVKSPKGLSATPNTPWLNEEDTRKLLEALPLTDDWRQRRDRLAVLLLVGLGWRRAEVARMRVEHFQGGGMSGGVGGDAGGGAGGTVTGVVKGGKVATVGVPSWLMSEVERWVNFARLGKSGPLLPRDRLATQPVTDSTIYDVVVAAAKRAGVTITPHGLRRTFITTLRGRGTDLKTLQLAVAHSSSATTERYDRAREVAAPGEGLVDLVYGSSDVKKGKG